MEELLRYIDEMERRLACLEGAIAREHDVKLGLEQQLRQSKEDTEDLRQLLRQSQEDTEDLQKQLRQSQEDAEDLQKQLRQSQEDTEDLQRQLRQSQEDAEDQAEESPALQESVVQMPTRRKKNKKTPDPNQLMLPFEDWP